MWDMTDLSPIVCWSLHDCGVMADTTITAMCLDRSHLMVGARCVVYTWSRGVDYSVCLGVWCTPGVEGWTTVCVSGCVVYT